MISIPVKKIVIKQFTQLSEDFTDAGWTYTQSSGGLGNTARVEHDMQGCQVF
ncbi:hypothetical protein NGY2020031_14650 [Vibrio cholerae]